MGAGNLDGEVVKLSCENSEAWQRATELCQFSTTGVWIESKMCWECHICCVKPMCIYGSGM